MPIYLPSLGYHQPLGLIPAGATRRFGWKSAMLMMTLTVADAKEWIRGSEKKLPKKFAKNVNPRYPQSSITNHPFDHHLSLFPFLLLLYFKR